jgi:hypothetical protein
VGDVFISYRREDSAGHAGRICEHLTKVMGGDRVFMDIQDIAPGQDFAEKIESTIQACQTVIVLIGPRWLEDLKQRAGTEDFVLREVSAALRRKVTVIPVLVGGAAIPKASDLPESLQALPRLQALEIRDSRFDDDVKLLERALHPAPAWRRRAVLAAGVLAAAAGALLWTREGEPEISGVWIAEMQKEGQRSYRVRLEFAQSGEALTGSVAYPTGDAAIHAGTVRGGRIVFDTTHVPQFASAEVTIRWTGTIEGETLRLTAADPAGVAKGVAKRR